MYYSQKRLQFHRNSKRFFNILKIKNENTVVKDVQSQITFLSRRSVCFFYVSYLVEDHDSCFIALNLLKSIFLIGVLRLLHTIVERP